MPSDPKLELLRGIPLFARLGKAELVRLGQLADQVEAPAGRVLIREGEFGSEAFVMVTGHAQVVRGGTTIAELGPGDWFGEMAVLSEGTRTATVTATEPSRLFVVAHREFHALMDEMPTVRTAVLDCLAERIRRLETEVTH